MKFLDSSIWLDHLFNTSKLSTEIIQSDQKLFSSILTLFEVRKRLIKLDLREDKINLAIDFIKNRSIIINLNEEIVNSAVKLSTKHNLAIIDSLIYSSALNVDSVFVTADNDFRGLEKTEIIDK